MNARKMRVLTVWVCGWSAVASAGQLPATMTLARYIPDDVFMFANCAGNPERDFITRHWDRVYSAVQKSGVGEEIKTLLLAQMGEAERAQAEEIWKTIVKLYEGVQWSQLANVEMSFGMRLLPFPQVPEIVVLMRGTAGSVDTNMTGIRQIFETLASLQPGQLKVTDEELMGAKVCSLSLGDVPFSPEVFRRADVIGLTTSRRATTVVLTLMVGEKEPGKGVPRAVADNPRFKAAVAQVETAEDALVFVDCQRALGDVRKLVGAAVPAEAATEAKIINAVLDEVDLFDYAVTSEQTGGMQTTTHNYACLRSDAAGKRLYKVFANRKPFDPFDKFIPAEATGFAINSGVDLSALYSAVIDFIKKEIPNGDALVGQVEGGLAQIKFDPQRDLFEWLGGESISVVLPAAIKTPMSGEDYVMMVRVKDGRLASSKIFAGIARLSDFLSEQGWQGLMIADASDVNAEGFRTVTHPMVAMFIRPYIGVSGDWLMLGSSAAAVNKCLDAGSGKKPTIATNPRFKAEGIIPTGPVVAASFTDLSGLGQAWAGAFGMLAFASPFIPDEPDTKIVKALINSLGRLAPAMAEINFFSSQSSAQTFDGQAWREKMVVTYRQPPAPTE